MNDCRDTSRGRVTQYMDNRDVTCRDAPPIVNDSLFETEDRFGQRLISRRNDRNITLSAFVQFYEIIAARFHFSVETFPK